MAMERRVPARDHGFTLPEVLVAIATIAVLMAALLTMLRAGQEGYFVGSGQVEAQQSLRLAVDRMVRELRNAGYCPVCSAACANRFPSITNQSATGFTIQNDWNGDYNCATGTGITMTGTVVDPDGRARGEQVTYAVSGDTLTRFEVGVDAAPVTLAAGIKSLTFSYLDGSGAATSVAASIRTVVLSATAAPAASPAADQAGNVQVAMTDSVRLRNLGP